MSGKSILDRPGIADLLRTEKYTAAMNLAAARGDEFVVVPFTDLYNFDPEVAMTFIRFPDKTLSDFNADASDLMRQIAPEFMEEVRRIIIRIRGLPREERIRRINSEHINKAIQVSGIVKSISMVQPLLTTAVFRCESCGNGYADVGQINQFLSFPQERCPECDGKRWLLVPQRSSYVDRQWMTVQEAIENLPPGQLPRDFKFELKGPLTHAASPGDRVKVVAVVDVLQKNPNDTDKELELYARAVDADVMNQEEQLEITDAVKARIEDLAKSPNLDEMMIESLAPSLYGLKDEKLSCLLQLFGGVGKEVFGTRIRGDIHCLLLGDPGTGKSQLLRMTSELSPRGMFTTGRGASGAGLTASVIREKDQGYVLEAGALVISDRGYCGIDEIDKMNEDDRQAIHPAMEQQVVSINKAGINAELNCRCAIGAAGNPKDGKWDPYKTILHNMDLPVTILNRFDLIWIIVDNSSDSQDESAASHVLNYHSGRAVIPPIDSRTIKQFILYARHIKPALPAAVTAKIQRFYMSIRKQARESDKNTIMITLRQLESIIRVTEAHARLHLREEATEEDADIAIKLIQRSLQTAGMDPETGEVNLATWYQKTPTTFVEQRDAAIKIVQLLKEGGKGDAAHIVDLQKGLEDKGISAEKASKVIATLLKDGTLFSPSMGKISVA
jgi:replicative DNA helicase Mcm